jgi:hypothetical protein
MPSHRHRLIAADSKKKTRPDVPGRVRHAGAAMAAYSTSWSREDEPLMPSLERLEEPPRLEPLDPDEALMPPSRLLELDELEPVEPLFEALRPPWPERSCELPRPEFVLPDAPRPSLREEVLLSLPEFAAL